MENFEKRSTQKEKEAKSSPQQIRINKILLALIAPLFLKEMKRGLQSHPRTKRYLLSSLSAPPSRLSNTIWVALLTDFKIYAAIDSL
jgi:hypothetical protein